MLKLHGFLLCAALATAGAAFAVPVAGQFEKGQIGAGQQVDKNQSTAASGHTQPVAASSDKPNNNPGVSSTDTKNKGKSKSKNKAKPAPTDQEKEFDRVLLGIYG